LIGIDAFLGTLGRPPQGGLSILGDGRSGTRQTDIIQEKVDIEENVYL
jgi:hypothetical protein